MLTKKLGKSVALAKKNFVADLVTIYTNTHTHHNHAKFELTKKTLTLVKTYVPRQSLKHKTQNFISEVDNMCFKSKS